jgi:hypothetical protein
MNVLLRLFSTAQKAAVSPWRVRCLLCYTRGMTTRTQTVLRWTPLVLVSVFLLLASALPKLFMSYEGSPLQPSVEALGVWGILKWIGALELVCSVLLLIRRTQTVGFILTVGLLGGAMATTLTHPAAQGAWWWFPLVMLLVLSVSAYFLLPELLDRLFKRPVPVSSRAGRIAGWICAGLVGLMNIFAIIMKYVPVAPGSAADTMNQQLGTTGLMHQLGVLEIIVTLLFLIPRTSTVGFVLMTGYMGGVLATNLSHGATFADASILYVLLALLTISGYFRNPELASRLLKR